MDPAPWRPMLPQSKPARYGVVAMSGVVVAVVLAVAFAAFGGHGAWRLNVLTLAVSIAGGAVTSAFVAWTLRLTRRRDAQNEKHQAHQRLIADRVRADGRRDRAVELLSNADPDRRRDGFAELDLIGRQDPEQRQYIVDQIHTYLRKPFTMPQDCTTAAKREQASSELEVRARAQKILTDNLRDPARATDCNRHLDPTEDHEPWDVELDLSSTILINISIAGCILKLANFAGTEFRGPCGFDNTLFDRPATFAYASFGDVGFPGAVFTDTAEFLEAQFGSVWFGPVSCQGQVVFVRCAFEGQANLGNLVAERSGSIRFSSTVISKPGICTWPSEWREAAATDGTTTLIRATDQQSEPVKEMQ